MEETTFLHSLQPISISSFHAVTPSLSLSSPSSHIHRLEEAHHHSSPSALTPPVYDGMEDDELGEDEMCSSGHAGGDKKRRLSTEQVRALDKNFEVDNKLDPERKVRLAQELALQPRQVAVWFQNRRARWKTKLLERDYTALKSSYDALRHDLDALRHTNHSLLAQIKQLKSKLGEEEESYRYDDSSVKAEPASDVKAASEAEEPTPVLIFKDGSSEYSDSSAVLNDDTNSPAIFSASGATFWASGGGAAAGGAMGFSFQHQMLKAEEDYDEPCSSSFFSDEQPPSLPW